MKSFLAEDFAGAEFRDCDFRGARFVNVEMVDVELSGEIESLRVNGIEVTAYVEAELDKVHPIRVLLRSHDPSELRQGWAQLRTSWDETTARIEALTPEQLRESTGGEWSALQTLRHLVYATDCWVRRAVVGKPEPWWAGGLPWTTDWPQALVGTDPAADPSLAETLAVRRDRVALVTSLLESADAAALDAPATGATGPGWILEEMEESVGQCLRVVLNEEFWHRQYCERDLAALRG